MPGKAVCLGVLLLGLACGLAVPAAAQAQEVTVSGVVTSSVRGEPIAGASVYALGSGENYGAVMTDSAGQWTRQLAPGSYLLHVEASGYYLQPIGAAPADSSAPGEEQITAGGSNQFNAALVPNAGPYVGVSEATLSWSPATSSGPPGTQPSPQPFASMVYQFRYGAYAALPPTWPADELFARLVDTSGSVVSEGRGGLEIPAAGGGGATNAFGSGSAVGCEFSQGSAHWEPAQLRAEAYVASTAQQVVSQPLAINSSGCEQMKLKASWLRPVSRKRALLELAIYGRAPNNAPVAGTATFLVDGRGRMTVSESSGAGNGVAYEPSERASVNVVRLLHAGSNTVRAEFTPSVTGYDAPAPLTVDVRVASSRGHRCRKRRRCRQ